MKIVEIREKTMPISSPIRNAYIDFQQDDAEPGRRDHRRDPRRQAGGRLRLQLQRPLRPGQADARALHPARAGGRARSRWSTTRGDNLDPHKIWDDDVHQREAGRPRRALGRDRHHRHGGLGRGRQDRGQAAVPAAGRPLRRRQAEPQGLRLRRRRLLLPGPGPRQAARTRCAATSTAATRWSRRRSAAPRSTKTCAASIRC